MAPGSASSEAELLRLLQSTNGHSSLSLGPKRSELLAEAFLEDFVFLLFIFFERLSGSFSVCL